ncbi:MAG: ribose 5-phosphate isomerase [Candidatus Binatota bacterium]|nr:ribose 5-phosphate isomerase [Candidatus Binatota bacterium]
MEGVGTLRPLAEAAADLVTNGARVGLGTGRAASAVVRVLGERVAAGLRFAGVPTSEATRALAESLGIPLLTLADAGTLDLTIDGADEIDPRLDLIKGLGGALLREKVVAASSARLVIVAGEDKLVERLGVRTPLPVEVIPFALPLCVRRIAELGARPVLRGGADGAYLTDNRNHVLDCKFPEIADPAGLDRALRAIPGVAGTGLFVGMVERALVLSGASVKTLVL